MLNSAALEPKETRWAVLVFSHSLKVKSFWGGSGTMTQDYWTRSGELRAPYESPYMLSLYCFRHPCFLPFQLCWDHLSYKQTAAGLSWSYFPVVMPADFTHYPEGTCEFWVISHTLWGCLDMRMTGPKLGTEWTCFTFFILLSCPNTKKNQSHKFN